MPDESKIIGLLKTKQIGKTTIVIDTTASTNDYIKQRIFGLEHGTVVITKEQTNGKGRLGRSWAFCAGDSLALSILLKPDHDFRYQLITQAVGLCVARALIGLGYDAKIKWPNDIIIEDKKVCGILCENKNIDGKPAIICGIGVNLKQSRSQLDGCGLYNAGSLSMFLDTPPSLEEVAGAIINHFEPLYEQLILSSGLSQLVSEISELCVTLSKEVIISEASGNAYKARAVSILDDGALLIETKAGRYPVYSGDVSVRSINGYI